MLLIAFGRRDGLSSRFRRGLAGVVGSLQRGAAARATGFTDFGLLGVVSGAAELAVAAGCRFRRGGAGRVATAATPSLAARDLPQLVEVRRVAADLVHDLANDRLHHVVERAALGRLDRDVDLADIDDRLHDHNLLAPDALRQPVLLLHVLQSLPVGDGCKSTFDNSTIVLCCQHSRGERHSNPGTVFWAKNRPIVDKKNISGEMFFINVLN